MPSLQVREMPTALYRALQESAKREHRSIAQQAIVTLSRGMNLTSNMNQHRRSLLDAIKKASVRPPDLELSPPEELINEDRNR